jgi:hypothetical protein
MITFAVGMTGELEDMLWRRVEKGIYKKRCSQQATPSLSTN